MTIRVITATNRDLLQKCKDNTFRFDLFYRLSVVDLTLPPLRERGVKEIEEIFEFLLKKKKNDFNKPAPILSESLKKKLFNYSFPGNIRELSNLIERFYSITDGEVTENDFPKCFHLEDDDYSLRLIDVENKHIKQVLKLCNNNIASASRILGVSRNTLNARIKDFKMTSNL